VDRGHSVYGLDIETDTVVDDPTHRRCRLAVAVAAEDDIVLRGPGPTS
jgi:hypothetical protein